MKPTSLVSIAFFGALAGAAAAAKVDYDAFRSWKTFQNFRTYEWNLAAWRWAQGAVVGAVGALGAVGVLNS